MSTAEVLYEAAQRLTASEKEDLADRLLADRVGAGSRLHPAWADELTRRSAEVDAGAVPLLPWVEVRDRARKAAGLEDAADA